MNAQTPCRPPQLASTHTLLCFGMPAVNIVIITHWQVTQVRCLPSCWRGARPGSPLPHSTSSKLHAFLFSWPLFTFTFRMVIKMIMIGEKRHHLALHQTCTGWKEILEQDCKGGIFLHNSMCSVVQLHFTSCSIVWMPKERAHLLQTGL